MEGTVGMMPPVCGRLGGYDGVGSGNLLGNGPGAPAESSAQGNGAAYGGHGSGGAETYGDAALNFLLGGSSGGSGQEGSGAGGGALFSRRREKLRFKRMLS